MRKTILLGLLTVADAVVLATARPDLRALARHLRSARTWVAEVGADRALASCAEAMLFLAGLWLAAGLVAILGTRLPGGAGRLCARAADVVLPRAMVRMLAGAAGLGILVAPLSAQARSPGPATMQDPAARPAVTVSAVAGGGAGTSADPLPPPIWPSSPAHAQLPAPTWPRSAAPTPAPHGLPSQPPARTSTGPHPAPKTGSGTDTVRVRPGDSLWLVAASRLGPQASSARIAAEWPRWYAANRAAIGPDPDVIAPGTVLHAPPDSAKEPPVTDQAGMR